VAKNYDRMKGASLANACAVWVVCHVPSVDFALLGSVTPLIPATCPYTIDDIIIHVEEVANDVSVVVVRWILLCP